MSKCKVSYKTKKTSNLGPKIPHMGIFRQDFEGNYCHIYKISTLKFVKVKNIHVKPNKCKFGTKIPIIWVHLKKKTIAIFEITTFEFFKFQSFVQN